MNRGKKLIILCCALVVLGAGYVVARTVYAEPTEEEEGVALEAPEEASRLEWTYDGATLALVKEDDSWSYADDDVFPLDQSVPENMTGVLSGLTASRVLDEPGELADYGLDEPALTVTATDADGTTYTFAVGDQNEVSQEYYLLYNGDESKVYMVDSSLGDAFSLGLYDMVQMESLPMFGTVTGLSVTQPGGSISVSYVEDSESLYYDSSAHWFLEQEDGTQLALDTGKVTSLTASVTGLTWISCVNYDADDQELAAWGLEESSAVKVVLTYEPSSSEDDEEESDTEAEPQTFVLYLGNDTDEGTYARLADSRMVYLINSDTADSLRYTSYSSLRPAEICSVDWNTVDRLEVTVDGTTNTISFDEQEEETTADGGDTVTETVPLYTWNGTEMDTTSVESLLNAIDALTATGDAGGENQGELLASFTIYRDSTYFTELTLELYAYDTSSCLAVFNGGTPRLVDRSAVTTLTDALDSLFTEE